MSKSDKTQAFYDRKERGLFHYYSYPQCGFKKPLKYKRAKIKNYWNSKQYKETSNPVKDIASLRWYWD